MAQVQKEVLGGKKQTAKNTVRNPASYISRDSGRRKEAELQQKRDELNDTKQLNLAKRRQKEASNALITDMGTTALKQTAMTGLIPYMNLKLKGQESELNRLAGDYKAASTPADADRIYAAYEKKYGEYEKSFKAGQKVLGNTANSLESSYEKLNSTYLEAHEADEAYIRMLHSYQGKARGLSPDVRADLKKRDEARLQAVDRRIQEIDRLVPQKEQERDRVAPQLQYMAGANAGFEVLDRYNAEIQGLRNEQQECRDYLDFQKKYGSLKYESDFDKVAKYQTSDYTGYNTYDQIYETVNGKYAVNPDPELEAVIRHMTQDEKSVYNYICAKEGKKQGEAYLNDLKPILNLRNRVKEERQIAEFTEKGMPNAITANAVSLIASPMKGLAYIGQGLDYLMDGKIDQNAPYNRLIYGSKAVASSTDKMVRERWGEPGSFAYNTGMSMLNFLMNLLVAKGIGAGVGMSAEAASNLSLALMGTGAAADATIEAKDRGLSDGQAFTLGTIAGLAEIVTEKFSLDTLLDKVSLGESKLLYFLKNAFVEGTEEVGSDVINTFADILIAKDKSGWAQTIQAYRDQNMPEDKAFFRALKIGRAHV